MKTMDLFACVRNVRVLPLMSVFLGMMASGRATAQTFVTLHNFQGGSDGSGPNSLVQGVDGNFYGTTQSGGTNNAAGDGDGTVFKITTNGDLTSLYSFGSVQDAAGDPLDGEVPNSLLQSVDGNLYGTTQSGGTNYDGTVFKITTNGVLTTLYLFGSDTDAAGDPLDGEVPNSLLQSVDGNLYGTTQSGGTNFDGTVFEMTTNGTLTTSCSFLFLGNPPLDGFEPRNLLQSVDGTLYGTTQYGGFNNAADASGNGGAGTVFEITTNGVLTTLYWFGSVQDTGGYPLDGAAPNGLVQGVDGILYGTTQNGGANSNGTVFKMTTNGTLTTLYSFGSVRDAFGDTLDGAGPVAALVQGRDGNLYGTTAAETRVGDNWTAGTVFQITTNGRLTTLHTFGSVRDSSGNPLDGAEPLAPLVQGRDGDFYGVASGGGTDGYGTFFRIVPSVTTPPAISLSSLAVLAGGQFRISFSSQPDTAFDVLFSTNLMNWAVLTTITNVTGNDTFSLPTASSRAEFYRLRTH